LVATILHCALLTQCFFTGELIVCSRVLRVVMLRSYTVLYSHSASSQ
jgi:hypothetical protein